MKITIGSLVAIKMVQPENTHLIHLASSLPGLDSTKQLYVVKLLIQTSHKVELPLYWVFLGKSIQILAIKSWSSLVLSAYLVWKLLRSLLFIYNPRSAYKSHCSTPRLTKMLENKVKYENNIFASFVLLWPFNNINIPNRILNK